MGLFNLGGGGGGGGGQRLVTTMCYALQGGWTSFKGAPKRNYTSYVHVDNFAGSSVNVLKSI